MSLNFCIKNVSDNEDDKIYKSRYYFVVSAGDTELYDLTQYRLRTYYRHHYAMSCREENNGLMLTGSQIVSNITGFYDDWCLPNRPPRVDISGYKFDQEVGILFETGTYSTVSSTNIFPKNAELWFTSGINPAQTPSVGDYGSSYSFLPLNLLYKNPLNIILEKIDISYTKSISSISSNDNIVTVVTSTEHGYQTGDSITITGITTPYGNTDTSNHMFGNTGERYMGTFNITRINSTSFTYITNHELNSNETATIYNSGISQKWVANPYNLDATISGNGSGLITITLSDSYYYNFNENDNITILSTTIYDGTFSISSVSGTHNNILIITNITNTNTTSVSGEIIYSSRPPSKAIPINYNSLYEQNILYDHTSNTVLVYPLYDTYTDSLAQNETHESSMLLHIQSHGTTQQQFSFFNFPIPSNWTSTNKIGEFGIYLESSDNDNVIFDVFQMTSDAWVENSSYSTLNSLISSSLVSEQSYENSATDAKLCYIRFSLSENIIASWLTGNPHSFVLQKNSPANSSVIHTIYSKEQVQYKPYVVFSGGYVEDEVKPNVEFSDIYMYMVGTSIISSLVNNVRYLTISLDTSAFTDNTDYKYIRSGNFIKINDNIEVFNTSNLDSYNTHVSNIIYDQTDTYPISIILIDESDNTFIGEESSVLIRDVDSVILTYNISDEKNIVTSTDSVIITPSNILNDVILLYNSSSTGFEFDGKINTTLNSYVSLNVNARDYAENISDDYYYPVITEFQLESLDPFSFIGKTTNILVKGLNISSGLFGTSDNPYVVLGNELLEDGFTSYTISNLTQDNNTFTFTKPNGLQKECRVLNIDNANINYTKFLINSVDYTYKVGDLISFISTGNFYVDNNIIFPNSSNDIFKYGKSYYIASVEDATENNIVIGQWITITTTFISIISSTLPTTLIYVKITDTYDWNEYYLYGYNPITSMYATNATYLNTNTIKNRLYIRIDEYSPIIYISEISGVNSTFDIYLSDLSGINIDTLQYSNNVDIQNITYLLGNDDNRFVKLTFITKSAGTFILFPLSDSVNNSTTQKEKTIPTTTYPFIQLQSVNLENNVLLTFNVYGENMETTIMENPYNIEENGIFVEGSEIATSYGNIETITTLYDTFNNKIGITFTLYISEISNGIMTIYARDNIGNTDFLVPPILTSKSVDCTYIQNIFTVYGINLAGRTETYNDNTETYYLLNNSTLFDIIPSSLSYSYKKDFITNSISTSDDNIGNIVISLSDGIKTNVSNTLNILTSSTPILTISPTYYEVIKYSVYSDPGGITAIDFLGNDISNSVKVYGSVNTSILGEYNITYTATDSCGNSVSKIRIVKVVTGCPIYITTEPKSAYVGDTIRISILNNQGDFNENLHTNVVLFNNTQAEILSGSRSYLDVIVPSGIGSCYIQVLTGSTNEGYETCSDSNVCSFVVLETKKVSSNIESVTNTIKSIFKIKNRSAIYNKDYSYSGFSEVTDENSLIQNAYSCLLTNLGERLYNSEFGIDLERQIFNIMPSTSNSNTILSMCTEVLNKYESRITVNTDTSFVNYDTDNNLIVIVLGLILPKGNCEYISLTFKNRGK